MHEVTTPDLKEAEVDKAQLHYDEAEIAAEHGGLSSAHPIVLGLALNVSVSHVHTRSCTQAMSAHRNLTLSHTCTRLLTDILVHGEAPHLSLVLQHVDVFIGSPVAPPADLYEACARL